MNRVDKYIKTGFLIVIGCVMCMILTINYRPSAMEFVYIAGILCVYLLEDILENRERNE